MVQKCRRPFGDGFSHLALRHARCHSHIVAVGAARRSGGI
jgi:hypothetical protein